MFIFTDLDDTLLPKNQKLSDYTIKILTECQQKGHKIVFSTARSIQVAMPVYKQIKADYMVLNGGSSIYDKNLKLIYESRIGEATTHEIICHLEDQGLNTILIEAGDGFLTDNHEFVEKYNAKFTDIRNKRLNAIKMVYADDNQENAQYFREKYDLDIINYIGCNLQKVSTNSKADGNKLLLNLLKANEKTICFGDDLGDIEMLNAADYPVCMKNSQPGLLNLNFPRTEATCDEDGVAKYLEKHILNR